MRSRILMVLISCTIGLPLLSVAQTALRKEAETLQCRIDTLAPGQRVAARARADAACAIDVKRLAQLMAKAETVIVDVRAASPQQRSRIPNAISLQPSDVRLQPGLRKTPLVLVGDGKDDASLIEQCLFLKGNGFADVSVLQGGVVSWAGAGRPLIADGITPSDLQRLSQAELLKAALTGDKLILVAPGAKGFSTLLSNTTPLTSDAPDQIAAATHKTPPGRKFDAAIVVTSHQLSDDALKQASASARAPLFAFAGDARAFEGFLRGQLAIWQRAEGGERIRCPGL